MLENILLRETLDDKKINGRLWQKQVCDAARCLGLHARYTEVFNKYKLNNLTRGGLGNLLKHFVMGIVPCNYCT